MKSPFIIIQDFLSPLDCDKILDEIWVSQPDIDKDGNAIKMEKSLPMWDITIIELFRNNDVAKHIETTYNVIYKGLQKPIYEIFPENQERFAKTPGCENSIFSRKKWIQNKDIDLVGYIWLKNFVSDLPIDPQTDVYGGKMEFPVYDFSLVPQAGTLVIFPAGPHFITAISPVLAADLYQIKLHINVKKPDGSMWFYDPTPFTGTYKDWFKDLL